MSEDKARRWRHLTPAQRKHVMSTVAAIQSGLDELAGDVLDEALHPEHSDFLHPQDRRALQREQRRRGGEPSKVRHRPKAAGDWTKQACVTTRRVISSLGYYLRGNLPYRPHYKCYERVVTQARGITQAMPPLAQPFERGPSAPLQPTSRVSVAVLLQPHASPLRAAHHRHNVHTPSTRISPQSTHGHVGRGTQMHHGASVRS